MKSMFTRLPVYLEARIIGTTGPFSTVYKSLTHINTVPLSSRSSDKLSGDTVVLMNISSEDLSGIQRSRDYHYSSLSFIWPMIHVIPVGIPVFVECFIIFLNRSLTTGY